MRHGNELKEDRKRSRSISNGLDWMSCPSTSDDAEEDVDGMGEAVKVKVASGGVR